MKARSQWKTQAAYHTAEDITWMHAADKNTIVCNNTKHNKREQKSARPSKLKTAHSHNKTEHRARVSEPHHETETQDMSAGIQTPRSKHETRHTDERHTWKQDMTGVPFIRPQKKPVGICPVVWFFLEFKWFATREQ